MTWDEPRGKDDDGDKKRPFKCCSCRSTREHRCYKCFCGKCPAYTKKVPQRYGVKNQLPDSWPSNSSSKLGRNKETIVSGQSRRTDTSPKQQSVETSDPRSGDEHRPGFSSNPCTLRCWPAIRSGTRANGAEEKCSKAIALNSRAESGSSSRPSIEKERRGNDEVENQKVTTNEGDGVSSKAHTGSSSNWEALTEKELRGNDEVGNQKVTTKAIEGGSSKSHDGSSSVWDALVEKQLRASRNQTGWANKAGSASSWVTWRVNGSRDNAAGTASSWGTWRVNEPREKDEVGNQKVTTNEVESGSSKSHDESSSNWNALAGKALNGTETGWANKSGSASNWSTWRVNGSRNYTGGSASSHGTWRVNEPRGSGKVMANQAQGRSSKPVSLRPLVKSDSRWTSYTGKRSRGDQERGTNRIEDVSSRPWKMPRGRHQIVAYTNKDGSSEPGKQEVKDSRDEGGSYKSISHSAPSRSNSSWDAYTVKDARYNDYSISRNHEIMAYSAENGSSVPVLHSPNAGFISIPPSLHNPEETIYRAEDGSSKQVLRNHHAQSGSSGDALTVKEPSGNQEIMSYKAENGSSLPVLSNNAGFVSTPLSLTSKEPTGRSISEKESIKDGQHDVTILSKKLESIVRVDKKFTHPAVASLRYAKPPPSALSGKSYSPQNLARVGPASRVLWTGHIELLDTDNRMFEVFLAHSAAKVSLKAYKFAAQMADVLQFKIHPRRAFWPKIFQLGCPDARDVALYFYPERSGGSKQKYRELLKLLEHQDLMLRSVMGQVELLVFSSKLLSSKYQVLNGCIFMWGVFRKFGSNEVSCSAGAPPTPHLELAQAIANAS